MQANLATIRTRIFTWTDDLLEKRDRLKMTCMKGMRMDMRKYNLSLKWQNEIHIHD